MNLMKTISRFTEDDNLPISKKKIEHYQTAISLLQKEVDGLHRQRKGENQK